MMGAAWLFQRIHLFAFIIGLVDGILTALTLTASRVVNAQDAIDTALALRIAAASSLSGAFIFFVAEYARLRRELVHAERQLNLAAKKHLAATRLGRAVFRDTVSGTAIASACNFLGALLSLVWSVLWPDRSWLAIVFAIVALGALGAGVARVIYRNPIRWAITLMAFGIVLTLVGMQLRIV
jgi:predicted membrane protein (TIGR00267 family)